MAQGVGSGKVVPGAQDTFGGKFFAPVDYNGPALYVQGGDTIDPHMFGFPNSILWLGASVDQSNTYFAVGRPIQSGVQTVWQLVWYLKAGGEVAANTVLSGVTVRLVGFGI